VRHFATHLTMFFLYFSPINFKREVWGKYENLAGLNPFATSIDGFRWMFTIGEVAPLPYVAGSCAIALVIFFAGGIIFRRIESTLVDVL
jgi:ABC-type polysaccharide/polyol phosphate export permease